MEVRPGYKQTEVGVIPEDWNVSPLGPYGFTYGGLTGKSKHHFGRGSALYVTFLDVMNHVVIDGTNVESVQVAQGESQNAVRLGDLLFTGSSETPEEVAMCSLVVVDQERLYLNSFCFGLRINLAPEVDGLFLTYVMRSGVGRKSIASLAQGSTRYNISKRALLAAPLPLPPLLEQRAIATALSDVDALLDGLERLIAKKRDLKQAAMQQLLTGQTRLPGFSGEWEVKRLGDVATLHKGKGLPKSALSPYGSEPCVHYGELFTQYGETIRETISRTNKSAGEFRSVANDVLMPTSDVTPRGLAKASCVVADGVVLGGDILVIRTEPKLISGTFLSHVIRREYDQVLSLVSGTTVFHLYGADMKKFTFTLPRLDEQLAIVTVLADMDAELAALEARRDKTRDLKQAMMQELLTGRTRLI